MISNNWSSCSRTPERRARASGTPALCSGSGCLFVGVEILPVSVLDVVHQVIGSRSRVCLCVCVCVCDLGDLGRWTTAGCFPSVGDY